MVQGRGRLRFPVKAFQSAGVFSQLFWKKLQSDETAERSVFGLVHHAHPATAELLDDAVMGDSLADQWGGFHPRDAMLGGGRSRSQRTFQDSGSASLSISGAPTPCLPGGHKGSFPQESQVNESNA